MRILFTSAKIAQKTENGKRKAENFYLSLQSKGKVFRFSLVVGKRNAAIKPKAEVACELC